MIFNPYAPKSDQYQISPADSAEILHHILGQIQDLLKEGSSLWSAYGATS